MDHLRRISYFCEVPVEIFLKRKKLTLRLLKESKSVEGNQGVGGIIWKCGLRWGSGSPPPFGTKLTDDL